MNNNLQMFLNITLGFVFAYSVSNSIYTQSYEKPRIIVTTDITNEPDDQQSLVRLLFYSNNFEIEGLIGSTSIWKLSNPATHVIHECIDAYAEVRDNLLLHDKDYPSVEYLRSITKTGNRGYGQSSVNARGSEGSRLIIDAVDKDDPRPVWLLAWGGTNTFAQAIWTVQETRSKEEFEKFLSKIRIYDIAGQDDSGAWLAHKYPGLFIIRSVASYKGMSFRFSSNAWNHTRGGDESVVSKNWVKKNIQNKHGALGAMYPDALHLWEGDTPSYFYLMPNGLNDPAQQWQGSWGGRFGREKEKNVNVIAKQYAGAYCTNGCWINEKPFTDYWMYADAEDQWAYGINEYNNRWAAIFRWRTDFQNDFAARVDWSVKNYNNANHNPVIIVNGDKTKNVLYEKVSPGEKFSLDASKSTDPDGNQLNYDWWIYKEAGTYKNNVVINNHQSSLASVNIPKDAGGTTIHVVLTVKDTGSPVLTSYRRVVLDVTDER